MNNRYWAMRHGHSQGNEQRLIVSSPAVGLEGYGLTDEGQRQVEASLAGFSGPTRIVSSDFLRARETAALAAERLGLEVSFSEALRERFFGDFDGRSTDYYEKVWEADSRDAGNCLNGVESPAQVTERLTRLISELEDRFENEVFLLVSHGDPLQFLETAFLKEAPTTHRRRKPLATAEIRELPLPEEGRA